MVEGEEGDEIQIFREHPHSTWERYFSGDNIMDWLDGNVFGATATCSKYLLPGEIEGHYLN